MGAEGSFSEMAGEKYIRDNNIKNAKLIPLISASNVLRELDAGNIDKGIFPIENSNGGIVLEAIYAMSEHVFKIECMFELDVHHMLLVLPGTRISDIQSITSHDQALKQCNMYIKRVWPSVDVFEYEDTAKAAKDLSLGILQDTTAVIASRVCAELYGLEILEESIQDLKFNYTLFVVANKR